MGKRRSSKVIKDERRESVISQAGQGEIPPNGSTTDTKSSQPAAVSAAKQNKQNKDSPKTNRKDLKFSAKKESSLCSPKLTRKSKASGVAQRDSPKVGKKLPGSPKVAKKSSNPDAPKVAKKSSADSLKSAKKSSLESHTKTRKVAEASED